MLQEGDRLSELMLMRERLCLERDGDTDEGR